MSNIDSASNKTLNSNEIISYIIYAFSNVPITLTTVFCLI
jgi:hypothetical protein